MEVQICTGCANITSPRSCKWDLWLVLVPPQVSGPFPCLSNEDINAESCLFIPGYGVYVNWDI